MSKQKVFEVNTIAAASAAILSATLMINVAMAKGNVELNDTDGDGVISADEIREARDAHKAATLEQFDVDGNGELSGNEREAMRSLRYSNMLAEFDADADGDISREERRAAKEARRAAFEAMLDVNSDGELTAEETAGIDELKAEKGDGKHGKRGGKRGRHMHDAYKSDADEA